MQKTKAVTNTSKLLKDQYSGIKVSVRTDSDLHFNMVKPNNCNTRHTKETKKCSELVYASTCVQKNLCLKKDFSSVELRISA